jgi:glycosyltransferase involved in cell wall biosynthesis
VVVNEAMAAGLPVLGSLYSQAVEELVVDGVTGWTFRPDRQEELLAALDRVFSTPPDSLEQIRIKDREQIQYLTPEFVADRVLDAIHYVTQQHQP